MKKRVLFNILLGIVLFLFITSAAAMITLNFRPLYRMDVDRLGIADDVGMSKEQVVKNYAAVIEYCSGFGPKELVIPDFPMSDTGRIHFEEVRDIFVFFNYLALFSGLLAMAGIVYNRRRKNPGYLLAAGITGLGVPAVLACFVAYDWQMAFNAFHAIAFNNDYWLFDPRTDPVIEILPIDFFLHCAILLLSILALGSVACIVLYAICKRRTKNKEV